MRCLSVFYQLSVRLSGAVHHVGRQPAIFGRLQMLFFEKGYDKKYTDALSGWKNLVPLSDEKMNE